MKRLNISFLAIFVIAICSNVFAADHIFTLPVSGGDLKISAGWIYPNDPPFNGGVHHAIDYIASDGSINGRDVLAAYGGTIIQVVRNVEGTTSDPSYGNYVKIDHQNSYVSLYGHMQYNSPSVSVGDVVVAGQVIGKVGSTGYSTGPHLHFQAWKNNVPIDPYGWYTQINSNTQEPYDECNPSEYYFTENPPVHAPSQVTFHKTIPDDVLIHVIGTPNYFWIQNGLMCAFDSGYTFYTWGFDWNEAIEVNQTEVAQLGQGVNVNVKIGTCVSDQNSQRWAFDYASNTSDVIVKRKAVNWQQLGYAPDVWIPVSNSFLDGFATGPDLTNDYPYGAVLKSSGIRYLLVKGEQFGSQYAGQKMRLQLFSDNVYDINYYHPNFNVNVSQTVINNYPSVPGSNYEYIMDGTLIKGSAPEIYYLENGIKRHIADEATFSYYGFMYGNVNNVSNDDLNNFPTGPEILYSPSGGASSFDGGILDDGSFDSGLMSYWRFNDWQEFANFSITNSDCVLGSFKADVEVNSATNYYDVELKQLVAVNSGLYHLSFYVKSQSPMFFKLALQKDSSPWNNYGLWKEITSTDGWIKHQYIFNCTANDDLARLTFMLGQNTGHIYFDQVIFEPIGEINSPANSLISNGDFELGHFAPWFMEDNNNVANYYTDNIVFHIGENSMFVDPNQNGQLFEVQLRQNVNIVNGINYSLSFWAKSQNPRNLTVDLYMDGAPWTNCGLWHEFAITLDWQRYMINFTATYTGNVRFGIHLGDQDIPIWLDDIVISNSTSNEIENEISKSDFVLHSVSPNPFNSSALISYKNSFPKSKLLIYNVKGQVVRTLDVSMGEGSILWNAKDMKNKNVASGIYFCKLVHGDKKSKLCKMLYLK